MYNLKRRIASLAPISSHAFEDLARVQEEAAKEAVSCDLCQKSYASPKQLKGHLKSRKHAQELAKEDCNVVEASVSQQQEISDSLSDDAADLDTTICLFCNIENDDISTNMSHMNQAHGFFIPNQDYLIDLESLLSYLALLIADFNECLHCGAIKGSMESVQHHMISKGHCTINLDEKSKLDEFYDYPEDVRTETWTTGVDGELQLTNGKTLAHRSQSKSSARPGTSIGSVKNALPSIQASKSGDSTMLSTSSALSITPDEGLPSAANAALTSNKPERALMTRKSDSQALAGISDVQKRSLRAVEKKMMKMEIRARVEYQRKVEKIGNKQKHFKNDVPGPKLG